MNQQRKHFWQRTLSALSIEAIAALAVVPALLVLFDWIRRHKSLPREIAIPTWLIVPLLLAAVTAYWLVRRRLRPHTVRISGNSREVPHVSGRLHQCLQSYHNRIVVYRVLPFEISEVMFTQHELSNAILLQSIRQYHQDLSTIIVNGRGKEDFWDKTVYGRSGDTRIDCASWSNIDRMYRGGFALGTDHSPDTSHIGYAADLNDFGLLLIGVLRDNGIEIDRWVCGYDFYEINLATGSIEFERCLFSTNPDVLEAMERRANSIFRLVASRGHYHPLSDNMAERERDRIFAALRRMLCPGQSTPETNS
ncbi:MAG: hypothetical protein DKINENOH_01461 [bacterium]|nr:hypothetical protein [bacterium]